MLLYPGSLAQPSLCSPRYGGGSFSFSRLILSVTQRFSTEFELQQVRLWTPGMGSVGAGTGDPRRWQERGHSSVLPLPCDSPFAISSCPCPSRAQGSGQPGGCRGLSGGCRGGAGGLPEGAVGVPHTYCSPSPPWQLEQFKADNQDIGFGSGTRALEQALERTRANINWVKENQQTVLNWFQKETLAV